MERQKPLVECEASWVYHRGDRRVWGILGPPARDGVPLSADELLTLGPVVGVSFRCPLCPNAHRIAIPFDDCPDEARWCGGTGGWARSGASLGELTVHPSILARGGQDDCQFHGWIKSGMLTW